MQLHDDYLVILYLILMFFLGFHLNPPLCFECLLETSGGCAECPETDVYAEGGWILTKEWCRKSQEIAAS